MFYNKDIRDVVENEKYERRWRVKVEHTPRERTCDDLKNNKKLGRIVEYFYSPLDMPSLIDNQLC